MPDLGELTRVPVRQAFPDEARDFTPWLARSENLALIGTILGIDLEVEATEVRVGPFRADIHARSGDDVVVIENQFGATDHDHMGKLLVYAAGLGAQTMVWIAERFTDQHRATLDWLNNGTGDETAFFGLEIELWAIDASRPAPRFNVVCKPNNWVKANRAAVTGAGVLHLRFWEAFASELINRGLSLRTGPPQARNWLNVALGRAGFVVSLSRIVPSDELRCQLYIDVPQVSVAFEELQASRGVIESILGECEWVSKPGQHARSIEQRRTADLTDQEGWPAQIAWLIDRAVAFSDLFGPLTRGLDLSKPQADDHATDSVGGGAVP